MPGPVEGRRAVFLDRDGVLTAGTRRDGRSYAPTTLDELVVLPGAADAVRRLKDAGYVVVVVTNQPDVGNGTFTSAVLDEMHLHLLDVVLADAIEVCTCGDGCRRYKPAPGMLEDAADTHAIDLAASWMVGDRWRDVGAGKAAGCRTVFIDLGYDEALKDQPDHIVSSLDSAVTCIVDRS